MHSPQGKLFLHFNVACESSLVPMFVLALLLASRCGALSPDQPQTSLMDAPKSRGAVLSTTALGFAAVAADVFGTKRVAPQLDKLAQDAAGPSASYDNPTGRALSNIAPALLGATALGCAATPREERRRAVAVAGSFALMNPVILGYKSLFHRERPDPAHHVEYSFPSGHTTNAAFFSACLFTILIPPLVDTDRNNKINSAPIFLGLTALCTAAVAAGRVLTQAHFLSDTLAGAFLGFFFAGLAANFATPDVAAAPRSFEE